MKALLAIVLTLSTSLAASAYAPNERPPVRPGPGSHRPLPPPRGNGGGGGYYGGMPGGSYVNSCGNCGMSGSTLYCSCPDGRGNWYNTSINVANCRTPVANTFGTLTCD